ncbi:MAG: EF2563 family selenium-dependent molybdenum hydroxylase system protein [Proteobacteria bacterium]|nr:EF2563 family selenium-dependent molybdenum hydroxylase system protein [Pseudomonadota bacterium]MBU4574487.1 EF2563 family selenium-dependent molybdenum hydroxylase system protein [Pseudomonadota bacterium]MBU4598266.1 EF2563 family selenium-dependent molybdenum hydroxylase system protein [Pseudomonadota bacterium]
MSCVSIAYSNLANLRVLIRGAGEMASGVAHRLSRAGLQVVMTEIAEPLAVRRAVSFCEAVYDGRKQVEGLTACLVSGPAEARMAWKRGELPVLVDPEMACLQELAPAVIVDALLAKRNTGLAPEMAPLTIGLGPGFSAPQDAHLVIETNRGHNLGRLIYEGQAAANTGQPGDIGGYTHQRVLRSPAVGVFTPLASFGQAVAAGQAVGRVADQEVCVKVGGVLRGLIRPGIRVEKGWKVGDVDPRNQLEYLDTISEKARAIGGSVLEGIMHAFNR